MQRQEGGERGSHLCRARSAAPGAPGCPGRLFALTAVPRLPGAESSSACFAAGENGDLLLWLLRKGPLVLLALTEISAALEGPFLQCYTCGCSAGPSALKQTQTEGETAQRKHWERCSERGVVCRAGLALKAAPLSSAFVTSRRFSPPFFDRSRLWFWAINVTFRSSAGWTTTQPSTGPRARR